MKLPRVARVVLALALAYTAGAAFRAAWEVSREPALAQMGIRRSPNRPGPLVLPTRIQDMTDDQLVDLALARLHKHVQPDGPVGVVREDLSQTGSWAMTQRLGRGYLIHLGTEAHGEFLMSILCHEWAHCLAFPDSARYVEDLGDCSGHGPQWGIELSRAYRAVWYDQDAPDYQATPIPKPMPPSLDGACVPSDN